VKDVNDKHILTCDTEEKKVEAVNSGFRKALKSCKLATATF